MIWPKVCTKTLLNCSSLLIVSEELSLVLLFDWIDGYFFVDQLIQ